MTTLQWNTNGFYAHLPELQKIICDQSPDFICLQETRFRPNDSGTINGYTTYRLDRNYDGHASGGVAILCKNEHCTEELQLQTELECIAIRTLTPKPTTICSIYVPPNTLPNPVHIESLISQLPKPFIIAGDFNAHNLSWGSSYTNKRGKIMEESTSNLILLNNGSATHFCTRTGGFSIIDLSFCNPTLAVDLTWETLPDLCGSDHFPILIKSTQSCGHVETPDEQKKWNYAKANWELFEESLANNNAEGLIDEDIDIYTRQITTQIIKAAELAIGYKTPLKNKKAVPWWNHECEIAVRNKRYAFNRFKKKQLN